MANLPIIALGLVALLLPVAVIAEPLDLNDQGVYGVEMTPKEYARTLVPDEHWEDFDTLINYESGWNPTAQNPVSTAYGIGQFLDSTWATVGCEKTSDPKTQIDCTVVYIEKNYGDATEALRTWRHRLSTDGHGWY